MFTWRHNPVCPAFIALAFAMLFSEGHLVAEPRDKKERVPGEVAPRAQWRVWKDQFQSKRALRIAYRPAARKAAASEIALAAEGWQFLDYTEITPGNAIIEISNEAEPKKKLVVRPVNVSPGSFTTLLLRETEGQISAEIIDDNLPTTASHAAEITVRNFVPTLATLQVRIGEDLNANLISSESFLHARGLPRKSVLINSTGTEESGKPIKWTNEVDFNKVRRATLLIYSDSHGRIRPRVTIDGELAPGVATTDTDQTPPH